MSLLIREVADRPKTKALQNTVLHWFACHSRSFPWRKASNAFHILIAEVLLRQTQAERVVETYLELTASYPDPRSLSKVSKDELRQRFKLLGLVKRADRLIDAAKRIVDEYKGTVPSNLDALIKLPGIGIYSSRAILCMAFGKQVPMIDESSGRLLRRVLGLVSESPAYSDRSLLEIATKILPEKSCRDFNLGLLDIAAAFCHHEKPVCTECPIFRICSYAADKGGIQSCKPNPTHLRPAGTRSLHSKSQCDT